MDSQLNHQSRPYFLFHLWKIGAEKVAEEIPLGLGLFLSPDRASCHGAHMPWPRVASSPQVSVWLHGAKPRGLSCQAWCTSFCLVPGTPRPAAQMSPNVLIWLCPPQCSDSQHGVARGLANVAFHYNVRPVMTSKKPVTMHAGSCLCFIISHYYNSNSGGVVGCTFTKSPVYYRKRGYL